MARASTPTLLPLDRCAKIMGINPAHFNGAAGVSVMPGGKGCPDVWTQYAWQSGDKTSREELAEQIRRAEEDIKNYVHYSPAPAWEYNEVHEWESCVSHQRWIPALSRYMVGSVAINTKFGKLVSPGRKGVTAIALGAAVVYSDHDGDGYSELATITVPTSLTDVKEVKVYFAGKAGLSTWEVRPVKSKVIAGGSVTITIDAWMLLNPALWEALTTGAQQAINLEDAASYVTTVDVYREYADTTAVSAEFFWEGLNCTLCGGIGCPSCELTSQTGCAHIKDVELGVVVPLIASYSDGAWVTGEPTVCSDPIQVKLWYLAGDLSPEYLQGVDPEPLSYFWAETITYLAVARLERPFCSCGNSQAKQQALQTDLAVSSGDVSRFNTDDILRNPFGTRRGEVMAYQRIKYFGVRQGQGFAV